MECNILANPRCTGFMILLLVAFVGYYVITYSQTSRQIFVITTPPPFKTQSQQWEATTSKTTRNVIVSSNGKIVLGLQHYVENNILSIDAGKTFFQLPYHSHFGCVSSNGDQILLFNSLYYQEKYGEVPTNKLYRSPDKGQTWITTTLPIDILAVSCSDSARDIVISTRDETTYFGNLSVSSNYGKNWTTVLTANPMAALSISGNGKVILAGEQGNYATVNGLHVSYNFGKSFINAQPLPNIVAIWNLVATSSDGKYMAATTLTDGYPFFISSNYGKTWTIPTYLYTPSALQLREKTIVFGVFYSEIHRSNDFGISWVAEKPPFVFMNVLSCSANCSLMASVSTSYVLYMSV